MNSLEYIFTGISLLFLLSLFFYTWLYFKRTTSARQLIGIDAPSVSLLILKCALAIAGVTVALLLVVVVFDRI